MLDGDAWRKLSGIHDMTEVGVRRNLSSPKRIAYVGWSGHGNMGDDAIREAIVDRVAHDRAVVDIPDRLSHMRFIPPSQLISIPRRQMFLGGGTVIGRPLWRPIVRRTLLMTRRRPALMLGAGVQDPSFPGKEPIPGLSELRRWKGMLEQFDRVTVRGPRSVSLLARVGVESTIVGDPALLHAPVELPARPSAGVVGLSLGSDGSTWGNDAATVVSEMAALARKLSDEGLRVVFLVVNEHDLAETEACVAAAALSNASIELTTDTTAYAAAAAKCDLVVGERLHSLVLAAAVGVPIVGLEYQPKIQDFMESIGRGHMSVRTDVVTAAAILELVGHIMDNYDAERESQFREVAMLRGRLQQELDRMSE